jgi:ribosome-associated protein
MIINRIKVEISAYTWYNYNLFHYIAHYNREGGFLLDSRTMVERITDFLEDKKAKDISVIDIQEISVISDYFIVCNGTSTTHIKAMADEVEFRMKELGYEYLHREGYNSARWILLDYGGVVVHVFHEEDRRFYNLERLWSDGVLTYR